MTPSRPTMISIVTQVIAKRHSLNPFFDNVGISPAVYGDGDGDGDGVGVGVGVIIGIAGKGVPPDGHGSALSKRGACLSAHTRGVELGTKTALSELVGLKSNFAPQF